MNPTTHYLPLRRFFKGAQSEQYHFPFTFSFNPTQPKWNHSILHCMFKKGGLGVLGDMTRKKQKNNNLVTYIRVVACNHVPIANLIAETVSRFIRIHWQIQLHTSSICKCCSHCHLCLCCFFCSNKACSAYKV